MNDSYSTSLFLYSLLGFTYADRDAREKWASGMTASNAFSRFGGVGGTIVGGLVKSGMGKILR